MFASKILGNEIDQSEDRIKMSVCFGIIEDLSLYNKVIQTFRLVKEGHILILQHGWNLKTWSLKWNTSDTKGQIEVWFHLYVRYQE